MKSISGFLIVKYDYGHLRDYDLGGVKIEIARELNINKKDGNDQKATVIAVSDDCKWLKPGDVVWTHFLAANEENEFTHEGVRLNRISEKQVFFKIKEDGEIEVADGVYICKHLVVEAEKTKSGIYLTPFAEKIESQRLVVLHAPRNNDGTKPGDVIITKDDNNYTIMYNKEELVKIDYQFILGKYEEEPA